MILFVLVSSILFFIGLFILIYRLEYKEYKKYYSNKKSHYAKRKSFFLVLVSFIADCIF